MIVHKSTVDSTRFDSCIELQLVLDTYLLIQDGLLGKSKVTPGDIGFINCIRSQLVWTRYLPFDLRWLVGKPKVILSDIGYQPTRRTSI